MARVMVALALVAAGCGVEFDGPPEATTQQANSAGCSNGIEPAHCDGMSQADADAYCNFVCILDGDIAGWCRHVNGNDTYHGFCVAGVAP